jgi:hypothetical protein
MRSYAAVQENHTVPNHVNSIPVLLSTLIPWVFEVQLLMQIIINRIAIIAENQTTIRKLKWGTAAGITCINVAVFCIWLPSQTTPPVNDT